MFKFITSNIDFTLSCTSLFREDWLRAGNDFDHSILGKTTDCLYVSPLEKGEQGGCKTDVNIQYFPAIKWRKNP